MIELTIKKFIEEKLNIPVYLEEPTEEIGERYIVFEKTSSTFENKLHSSTFAFQSYAFSLYKVIELNNLLKEAIEDLVEENDVSSVRLVGDYNFTDTTKKKYRYQAVYNIFHY